MERQGEDEMTEDVKLLIALVMLVGFLTAFAVWLSRQK